MTGIEAAGFNGINGSRISRALREVPLRRT